MRTVMRRILKSVLVPIIVGSTVAFAAPPPLPSIPAPIRALLYARPFALNESFRYDWRQEKPMVSEGYLVVIEVDPDLVYPRQTAEPVLFVGDQTAMRLNVGYISGRVIALVPGPVALRRIWFGTPQLPEAVTAEIIKKEQALANREGIQSLSVEEVDTALKQGGGQLRVANFKDLLAEAARLINQYAGKKEKGSKLSSWFASVNPFPFPYGRGNEGMDIYQNA